MSECPYCQNTFEMTESCSDEFRMWQGLVGPYYIPSVDESGVLSWTNTGDLPNPDSIDIKGPAGASFSIAGIVETVGDLPEEAEGVWLVGDEAPYEGYSFVDGAWADIGQFAIGPEGPAGEDGPPGAAAGFGMPTATIDSNVGTPGVTVTASGPDTAKVFAFSFTNLKGATGQTGPAGQGVPTGGSTGQVLAKKSGTNYDTEWVNQSGGADPATVAPLMDGTAAVGTSTKYAREDHVHPTDTSRASASDLTTLQTTVGGITPHKASLTIAYASWSGSDPYTQTITISGATITSNTKVDIQADSTALTQLISDGVSALYIVNNSGILTLYAIGAATTADITVQVTYYETV